MIVGSTFRGQALLS